MTIVEFINKTDALGGLVEMYKAGYTPNDDLDEDVEPAIYSLLADAWDGLDKFFEAENDYYTYCENCGFEEQ